MKKKRRYILEARTIDVKRFPFPQSLVLSKSCRIMWCVETAILELCLRVIDARTPTPDPRPDRREEPTGPITLSDH